MTTRMLIAALALLAAFMPGTANAVPIPVGSELFINWDLTSETPPPPYTEVVIHFEFDVEEASFGNPQEVTLTLYNWDQRETVRR